MDEIPNGCPVGRIPISAKDVQHRLSSSEDSGDDGNQVARLLPRIFAQDTRLMATDLHDHVS